MNAQQINESLTQEFFNLFRSGYYSQTESGFCVGWSNRRGNTTIRSNSWENLLRQMIDWHDSAEEQWANKNGIYF